MSCAIATARVLRFNTLDESTKRSPINNFTPLGEHAVGYGPAYQVSQKYTHSSHISINKTRLSILKISRYLVLQSTIAMVPMYSELLQIPLYGLVAGAVVIAWSLAKTIQTFQSIHLFLVDSEPTLRLNTHPGWKYAREHGCQPPHSVSHGLFGLGMARELAKSGPEHRFLELIRGWHQSYSPTFKARVANRSLIFTVDPKNIQTVLALKFKDFGVGSARRGALRPIMGQGIFGVDGSEWEHARALLRPNFSRTRINDTELYESHVAELIDRIPRDGSTVDLLPLFLNGVRCHA